MSVVDSRYLEPLSVRIATAVKITGIGRSKLYELIKAGEIETVKVGASTLIPMASLKRFLKIQGYAGASRRRSR